MSSDRTRNSDKPDHNEDGAVVQEPLAQMDDASDGYGALLNELKQRIRQLMSPPSAGKPKIGFAANDGDES
jgi:hypothetical protein